MLESGSTHLEERKLFQIGCRHITSNILLSAESYGRRVGPSKFPIISKMVAEKFPKQRSPVGVELGNRKSTEN